MKHIVLAVALFSLFSSILSPITANALPVGNGWGLRKDALVKKLVQPQNVGSAGRDILGMFIALQTSNSFTIMKNDYPAFMYILNLFRVTNPRFTYSDIDPKTRMGTEWKLCSIR
ncbi:hypothetical protein ABID23_000588 [Bartonella silvatica]|uniref:Uncharacterized protein n=1 Tax=Bartonella silvatica TaxID=357760 RepID=A0ABV2HG30_9HYPH